MRTSSETPSRRVLRRVLQALACIVVLAIANVGVTLALEPYGSSTEVIWWSYREAAEEDIDTILLGTSVAKIGLSPHTLDESLGCSSWTLATDSQMLENSLRALQRAHDEHGVARAIIGISFSTLSQAPFVEASSTFVQGMTAGQGPLQIAASYLDLMSRTSFLSNSDSISCLFPWAYSNVGWDVGAITDNIRNRLECATPLDAGMRRFPHWTYEGKGYYYASHEINLEAVGNDARPADEQAEPEAIYEPNLATLEDIGRYCEEHGIALYVVVTPAPVFPVMRLGETYPREMQRAKESVEAAGGAFLDFNAALDGLYQIDYADFSDSEHLNRPGAERFCTALGALIARIEAGEDVSGEFRPYDEWDAWLRSLDHISVIGAQGEAVPGGVSVETWAWADPEIEVEYRLSSCDADGAPVETLVDWTNGTSHELPLEGHGTLQLRVDARRASAPGEVERSCRIDVSY